MNLSRHLIFMDDELVKECASSELLLEQKREYDPKCFDLGTCLNLELQAINFKLVTYQSSTQASGGHCEPDCRDLTGLGFPLHGSSAKPRDENRSIRTSSGSVMISRAAQRFEDANTEKPELAITNTVLVLPWKYETRPCLHLYTLSAQSFKLCSSSKTRERGRPPWGTYDGSDQRSLSLCSAHGHPRLRKIILNCNNQQQLILKDKNFITFMRLLPLIALLFATYRALLLVLTATLAGDGALRDAALAGDSDLGHAMFLLTASTAFINVIIA
ncbi:hypothetical protein F2Q69_00035909 [Brassica cretica]|uniref:Uncharacterized protein n=1 Tax=Brassica cretica TaxID=69181 RepID=A0A8S9SKT2_BRACR|nr:hypothetical protein F2Q69_00035909 [Brassica cretica]